MHSYYDRRAFLPGELVVSVSSYRPPTALNPTGTAVPAWYDDLGVAGVIPPDTSLIVLGRPDAHTAGVERTSMFVSVVAPELGRVWVMASDIRRTY